MEVSTEREPGTTNDGERTGKAVTVVAEADRIPAVYSDAVNSPIVAKVEAKPNEINLDLKRIPLRQLELRAGLIPRHKSYDRHPPASRRR